MAIPSPTPSSSCQLKALPNTWEEVAIKELMVKITKICSDHKGEAEGGEGVGPASAHQERSITAARKAGKPCDTLVDDVFIEVQELVKRSDKSDKGCEQLYIVLDARKNCRPRSKSHQATCLKGLRRKIFVLL
jgi:hypothetical protein